MMQALRWLKNPAMTVSIFRKNRIVKWGRLSDGAAAVACSTTGIGLFRDPHGNPGHFALSEVTIN
jgi:hypothetical protein